MIALVLASVLAVPPAPPSTLKAACQCEACPCKTSNVVTAKPKASTTGFRQPRGHTHTCTNGHTWDHDANPTHTCKFCGLNQFVQDNRPRLVTVTVTPTFTPAVQKTVRTLSAGGCANGNCPIAR
jgi:hypothetical protein